MTADDLRAFEREVASAFERGEIHAPVHLAGGNEEQLLDIFREIPRSAWVFSTWRSHYHALLHGIPRERVMTDILAGKSMMLHYPEHRFFTSAIVGGILPIACGVAAGGEQVWCFVGDMAASIGAYRDATQYAAGRDLPVTFVVEDNRLSTNTPTSAAWGWWSGGDVKIRFYSYRREPYPHVGTGVYVPF